MIDTFLLQQLTAVDECGTLSAASEKLHLSQPSLTRAMQKLEDQIGVRLFDRTRNRVVLNENGHLAAECAWHILAEEETMIARVRALDRSKRTICVGSISPGPMMELSPLLSSLYPEMTIITETRPDRELVQGLRQGLYQMIIRNAPLPETEAFSQPCGAERLYYSVPSDHPKAKDRECTFADIDGESVLMVSNVGYWGQIVRERMPRSRFLLQDDLDALDEVIRSSTLPSFATDLTIRLLGRGRGRKCLRITDDDAVQKYFLCLQPGDEKKYASWCQALHRRFS